jgi:hypothetical protein
VDGLQRRTAVGSTDLLASATAIFKTFDMPISANSRPTMPGIILAGRLRVLSRDPKSKFF